MHRFHRVGSLLILLVGVMLAGASMAEPPFGKHRRHHEPGRFIEEHAERLGLDGETLDSIQSIVESSRVRADDLHAEVRELHRQMHELLRQDAPDEAAVMQHADAIGQAETEMHKHRLATMLEIRALLTPEQRQELVRLREDFRERRGELREACAADVSAFCPDAEGRWSRWRCLDENRSELSEGCQRALDEGRRHRRRFHRDPRPLAPEDATQEGPAT
jgi:Spy/CpxP family protein refolding chaperone